MLELIGQAAVGLPSVRAPERYYRYARARVAELVDALDLGSSVLGRGGSSPPLRTPGVRPSCPDPIAAASFSEQVFSEHHSG